MPTVLPPSLVVSSGPRFSPLPRLHETVEAHEPATGHHDQRDRDVGDVVGQHVRGVRHLEPALPAVVDRHPVVADAEHRDDLERRQRIEQRRRRDGAAALNEPADGCAVSGKEPRLVGRLRVIVATVVRLQRLVEKRRQWRGDDDVGRHGISSSFGFARRPILATLRSGPRRPPRFRRRKGRGRARARRSADAGRTSGMRATGFASHRRRAPTGCRVPRST